MEVMASLYQWANLAWQVSTIGSSIYSRFLPLKPLPLISCYDNICRLKGQAAKRSSQTQWQLDVSSSCIQEVWCIQQMGHISLFWLVCGSNGKSLRCLWQMTVMAVSCTWCWHFCVMTPIAFNNCSFSSC